MGMNLISSCILAPYFLFQPTPPYGDEPRESIKDSDIDLNFNPHPRMGMNFYVYHSPCTSFITTHAPYGDEPSAMEAPLKAVSFQPTPPHGDEHQKELIVLTTSNISQSACRNIIILSSIQYLQLCFLFVFLVRIPLQIE